MAAQSFGNGNIPDTAWIDCRRPATTESVQITATDATMGDFDIDVGLLPRLRLVALPFHVPLGGARVETEPSLKLVRCAHDCGFAMIRKGESWRNSMVRVK